MYTNMMKVKSKSFKALSLCKNTESWGKYIVAKKDTKKAVSKARASAFDQLYQSLSTKKGERIIYKFAKGRQIKTSDLNQVSHIDHEEGKFLVMVEHIKEIYELFSQVI